MKGVSGRAVEGIYKFIFVFGLWLIVGLLILFVWFVRSDMEIENNRTQVERYYSSFYTSQAVIRRLTSIKYGLYTENKIDWVPVQLSYDAEEKLLRSALEKYKATMLRNKAALGERESGNLFLIQRWEIVIPGAVYVCMMVFFLVFFDFRDP